MPTTTSVFKIVKPASGAEPPNGYGALTDLADSVEDALSRPYCELTASAATSIPEDAVTKVTLATTTHIDTDYFSVASSVITVTETGVYNVNALLGFATAGVTSQMQGLVVKNGLSGLVLAMYSVNAVVQATGTPTGEKHSLLAGDTIQLAAYHNASSGTTAVNTAHSATVLSRLVVTKVG